MAEILFQLDGVKKHFRAGKRTVKALDGVSLDIRRGETLSLADFAAVAEALDKRS